MSQEFRLSIKNFSQRKIVNVKDIFKNLTESEKAILEREKQLAEEKVKRTKQQQQLHKKKLNLTKNAEFSKSSVNLPTKPDLEQAHPHQQRQSKPNNRYKIDYDETLSNRPWLLNAYNNASTSNNNEANLVDYDENFKRYISQIDLNLNKILNEKKQYNHHNHNQQTPVYRRESVIIIDHHDQDHQNKLNKFNGFKKKIKNLFHNNEVNTTNIINNNNNNNRPIHIIRLQTKPHDTNQYLNENNINTNFISDPFFIEATTNKKWNNHNKNFKYKSPLIKEYMFMNNNNNNNNNNHYNNNNNNDLFTGQNDGNPNNKFRKLSNLINRTKNLLH